MLAINEIVTAAHNETERKADQSKYDMRLELALGVQEFLLENRFWWAEKSARFSTVLGTAEYDLSDINVANVDDVSEIIKMYNVSNATNPSSFSTEDSEILPLLDQTQQIVALETTTPQPPSQWMPAKTGDSNVIRFQAPIDGVYPIRFLYSAVPNVPFNDAAETVPLIPGNLNYGLVIILKRRILDYLYGQEDPRFVIAESQYQKFIRNAARRGNKSAQAMRVWTSGDAVQSHG